MTVNHVMGCPTLTVVPPVVPKLVHDALLLQYTSNGTPDFVPMCELTHALHETYAAKWNMEYRWVRQDIPGLERMEDGGWAKVRLILDALNEGYQYVFWVDADAYIYDDTTDLRTAFGKGVIPSPDILACQHNPLIGSNIPVHLNVGVLFVRNTARSQDFLTSWMRSFEQYKTHQWREQGCFNDMAHNPQFQGIVGRMDDQWNSTLLVNDAKHPVIKAFHSGLPAYLKVNQIKASVQWKEQNQSLVCKKRR